MIPAVRDRIVQTAVKTVIEPVFEADMLGCSFGFRPRRSAHDALQVLVDDSPLLCNVYLHRLDRQWTERGEPAGRQISGPGSPGAAAAQ